MLYRCGAQSRFVVKHTVSIWVMLTLIGLGWLPCAASSQETVKDKPTLVAPSDAAELFDSLDDIDHLNVLIPLKLTGDQLDLLITAISSSEETFTRKYRMISVAEVRRQAELIRSTKKKALAGEHIPDEFINQMTALLQKRVAERTRLNTDTLRSIAATIHRILNEDQISTAAKQERGAQEKLGKHGTDLQMFNAFVQDVFMEYPRTIPLLKELRQSAKDVK